MEEKKDEDMDVAEDLYVASDLYEEDDVETGIRRGASPTRDGAPSPPRVQAMEVDSGTRTLRTAMRGLFGDVLELLKDRSNQDLISKEDCGAAGMHEAILWNTTSKVGYIVKLLHLAKEHELFALTPTDDGPLPDLIQQAEGDARDARWWKLMRDSMSGDGAEGMGMTPQTLIGSLFEQISQGNFYLVVDDPADVPTHEQIRRRMEDQMAGTAPRKVEMLATAKTIVDKALERRAQRQAGAAAKPRL